MDEQKQKERSSAGSQKGAGVPATEALSRHLIDCLLFIIDLFVNIRQKALDQIHIR